MTNIFTDKIKNLKNNPTVRNGALFTFFAFLNNGVSFLLLIILAHYIAPDGYGELNLFNTFVTLLGIFICLCTNSYIGIVFFKRDKVVVRKVINIALLTATGMLFVFSVVLSLFPDFLYRIVGISVRYQWIALLICYFQVFNNINLDIWRLEEKPVKYGLYSLSVALLNFCFTLFLVIAIHWGWLGRLYAQFYVAIVFFLVSILFLIKRKYILLKWPERSLFKETLLYALPIIPHLSSFWLRQGLDRYIINYSHTTSDVGLFSFAVNFASVINIVGVAFNATNSVFIYKKLADGYAASRSALEKQTRWMIVLFGSLTIGLVVLVSVAIPWLVPQYTACIRYLYPVCGAAFFQCLYLLYVNYLFYYQRTVQLMFITFSSSVLQATLSLILTPYSVLWTAYISLFTSFLIASGVYVYSRKILRLELV